MAAPSADDESCTAAPGSRSGALWALLPLVALVRRRRRAA
ncbi:MAG: MYXO-CTERM sorting domain-containing protein [bacterium]